MNGYAQAVSAGVMMLLAVVATAGQIPASLGQPDGLSLFVAVDGHDGNPGTKEKPFATLDRARDEVRRIKKAGAPVTPVTVNLRAGTYFLERTFTLSAEDSGTAEAPVVYRGYGQERPRLVGGKVITGFTPHKDQILVADVSGQGLKGVAFKQLFFDGRRQIMARYPNFVPKDPVAGGWAYVDGKIVSMYSNLPGESKRLFQFKAENARTWARCQDGDVFIFPRYNWRSNIIRIRSVDRDSRAIALAADCYYAIRPGDRYYVQGLFEELDAPGEWYLDQEAGKLYFWPPAPLEGKAVVAPTLESIIEMGQGTSHVTIQGFDIECCQNTAVILNNTTDCLVAGCVISKVGYFGGSGVRVSGGRANGVAGCDISECGNSGIVIRGGDRQKLVPADNYADNNYIHHVGVFQKAGMGIDLGGVGNRATHNLIHDGPRTGIEFSGNNHLIEYNHVRHVNLETDDTGALYSGLCDWLSARGTVVRYNYLHDCPGFGRDGRTSDRWISPHPAARGIYLDDNCAGVDVIGNIVARCAGSAVYLHNARDTRVENNIFIDHFGSQVICNGWTDRSPYWRGSIAAMVKAYESVADEPAWQKMRGMATHPKDAILPGGLTMSGNVLSTNIFYYHDPNAKLYSFRDMPFGHNEADRNLVWHNGLPIATGQFVKPLDEWQSLQDRGFDRHSLVADPVFVAPQEDDWRLKTESPAFKLGFKAIPVEKIGPYEDPRRASWPIVEVPGARERLGTVR